MHVPMMTAHVRDRRLVDALLGDNTRGLGFCAAFSRVLKSLMLVLGVRSVYQRPEGGSPTMRKLIVCNIISLDGFYSGPDGDVMVIRSTPASRTTTRNACERPIRCYSGALRTKASDPTGLPLPRT